MRKLALADGQPYLGKTIAVYDWRSKSEPLLWLADAVCAIAAESLLGHRMEYHERLEAAGLIEVIAADMRQPRLPS